MRWPWTRKPQHTFDSTPKPIDALFVEMAKVTGTTVTRSEALSVPAVRRGRNMLCAIATMPLEQVGPDNRVVPSPLLGQIDPDVPNVVTLAQTVEDLVLSSVAWWEVTAHDPAGFAIAARHLDVATVSLDPPKGRTPAPLPSGIDPREVVVWVDGKPIGASRIIRFDSPNPAFLQHAGRETRRAILLDKAASLYADDPRPADYFTPADNADEIKDAEVEEFLGKWKWARKRRATAYVPASVKYNSVDSPSPQQLQLVELGRQASLDIANSLGIDPEDLGISTTSRTYTNDVDRRRNRLNDVLSPYMRAITDRLSMGDVTRHGDRARFNTTEYLQPNPTDRWAVYKIGKELDVILDDEIRSAEGMPPLPDVGEDAAAGPAGETSTRELQLVEQIQKIYLGVGTVITAPEAREILNRSGAGLDVNAMAAAPAAAPPAASTPPAPDNAGPADEPADTEATSVDASRPTAMTFDDSRGLTFVDLPVETFSVNREGRVIEGMVLPYGQLASKYGVQLRFERGALQWDGENPGRVKLLRDHDTRQPLGKAIQLRETVSGLLARFKVARGAEGDRALELAEDGVLDGFSVGVDFDAARDTVPDPKFKGALLVRRADLRETSLTAMPSFDNARVTSVAASRTTTGGPDVANDENATPEGAAPDPAPATADVQFTEEQLTALLARPGALQALTRRPAAEPEPDPAIPDGGLLLSADQVDGLVRSGAIATMLGLPVSGALAPEPEGERATTVDPTRRPIEMSVTEPASYRFAHNGDLVQGAHDFGVDIVRAVNPEFRDQAAYDRVMEFMRAQFDVISTDVNDLNPTINMPRYIDEREFTYPIFTAVNRGAPPNGIQPFSWPKFNSASGLVDTTHTQGTEPASGTYATTLQSVTPVPMSGKAKLSREVWDMGGTPGLSDILWRRISRDWYEALEAAVVAVLDAATPTSLGTFTAGGGTTGQTLAAELTQYLTLLQFARGGFRFDTAFAEAGLYTHLSGALDDAGRSLFPVLGAQNASGDAAARWSGINVGGVPFLPAWALGATVGAVADSSYLIDRTAVDAWATPPQRLTIDMTEVANIYIGVWGYHAEAINDLAGVREVAYDPTSV